MSSTRSTVAPGRAVARWAWRLFRRDWRAQLLVLALIVVPVATAVVGASMAVESGRDPTATFGRAAAVVHARGDAAQIDAAIDAARQRFGDIEVIGVSTTSVPGSVDSVLVLAQDPTAPLGAPMIELREGRLPQGGDEVALSPAAAGILGVELGATVPVDRVSRTVVGIVANPNSTGMSFALVDPDGAPPPREARILVADVNVEPSGTATGPIGLVELRGSDDADRAVLVVVVVTMAMTLVGLVAAAGFFTIARRRQRQLGLLAAIGGSRRHLQSAMVVGGTIVGLVGAAVGTAVGVVAWQVVRDSVARSAQHEIGALELPWLLVAVIGLLAVATATIAAWWPARTASRVPVMTALSGRPVPPRSVRRPVFAGLLLVAGGAVSIALSGATRPNPKPLLLVVGMLVVIVGIVMVVPAVVGLAGRLAGKLPLAGRVAVRDVARHRARAAASVAAITLALGVTTGIVAVVAANADDGGPGNLPADQVLVRFAEDDVRPTVETEADRRALDDAAGTVASALGTDTTVLALRAASNAAVDRPGPPILAARRVDGNTLEITGPAYVATPEVLAHYGIDPASIATGTELLVAESGVDQLDDPTTRPTDGVLPTEQRDELPRDSSAPGVLITEATLARHGWRAVPFAWLIDTSAPLTADQLDAARAAAARVGLVVESRSTGSNDEVTTWATRIGVALSVLIVLMAVALSRADAAGDDRILTANGARPRTRRAVAAATAATLGLLGALLGTAGTYVVVVAAFRADLSRLWPAPWSSLVAVVVGLPVVAATIAWCTGGGEPAAMSRRPLD